MADCAFTGCGKRATNRGWCPGHNVQRLAGKTMAPLIPKSRASIAEKYEARVIRQDGCWGWTGTVNDSGYAVIAKDHKYHRAHRFAWEQEHGPIPDEYEIDHVCRTRTCTNPEHLRPATRAQNNQNRGGANRNSLTGVRNVSKHGNRYRVALTVNRKRVFIGSFPTIDEATDAAKAARSKYYTHSQN